MFDAALSGYSRLTERGKRSMNLTPREKDKLLVAMAAMWRAAGSSAA